MKHKKLYTINLTPTEKACLSITMIYMLKDNYEPETNVILQSILNKLNKAEAN